MFADVPEMPCILVTVCHSLVRLTSRGEFIVLEWADPGGGGSGPPFLGPQYRHFNIGPSVGPPPGALFLLV